MCCLPPEENEWLTASKLKKATDVVQDYRGAEQWRQTSCKGWPDSASAQGVNAVSQDDKTDSQGAAAEKPKRGRDRPRKTGNTRNAQKRGRGRLVRSSSVVQGGSSACLVAVAGGGHSWCLVLCVSEKVVCVHA